VTVDDALDNGKAGTHSLKFFWAVQAMENPEEFSGVGHVKARAVVPDKIRG
jgi:hypothetical protein